MKDGVVSDEELARRAEENRRAKKERFIKVLTEYLVGGQARRSIQLEMGHPSAKEWAKLRRETPLFGYPSMEEAEAILKEFFA